MTVTATLSTAVLAMDDAGFIVGSYAITFLAIGTLAWRFVRRGKAAVARVDDADKYWT